MEAHLEHHTRPIRLASTTAVEVSRSSEIGFSQNTCLPACTARVISSACVAVGVAIATASIMLSASRSSNAGTDRTSSRRPRSPATELSAS